MHALARSYRLPQSDPRVERPAQLQQRDQRSRSAATAVPRGQKAGKNDLPNLGPQTPAEKATANAAALAAGCIQSDGEPDFPDPDGQGVIQVKNATVILQLVGRPSGSS